MDSSAPIATTLHREPEELVECAYCDELNCEEAGCCWLCGRNLAADVAARQAATPVKLLGGDRPRQFSLETLLLLVTLTAMLLGLYTAMPGVGILAAIIAVPSVLRTFALDERYRQAGPPVTLGLRLRHFEQSFVTTAANGLAGVGAGLFVGFLGLMCAGLVGWAINDILGVLVMFTTLIVSLVVSLTVMIRAFARCWPRQYATVSASNLSATSQSIAVN
jgi:hypothetical protein